MINTKLINNTYYKNGLENMVMHISLDTKYTKYIIG
jgi:ketol-acid reductoisomerase